MWCWIHNNLFHKQGKRALKHLALLWICPQCCIGQWLQYIEAHSAQVILQPYQSCLEGSLFAFQAIDLLHGIFGTANILLLETLRDMSFVSHQYIQRLVAPVLSILDKRQYILETALKGDFHLLCHFFDCRGKFSGRCYLQMLTHPLNNILLDIGGILPLRLTLAVTGVAGADVAPIGVAFGCSIAATLPDLADGSASHRGTAQATCWLDQVRLILWLTATPLDKRNLNSTYCIKDIFWHKRFARVVNMPLLWIAIRVISKPCAYSTPIDNPSVDTINSCFANAPHCCSMPQTLWPLTCFFEELARFRVLPNNDRPSFPHPHHRSLWYK